MPLAECFDRGDFTLLVGKSGAELDYEVLESAGVSYKRVPVKYKANRSEEYWTGWALTYYQWENALSFEEIVQCVPVAEICLLYSPYHEMHIG